MYKNSVTVREYLKEIIPYFRHNGILSAPIPHPAGILTSVPYALDPSSTPTARGFGIGGAAGLALGSIIPAAKNIYHAAGMRASAQSIAQAKAIALAHTQSLQQNPLTASTPGFSYNPVRPMRRNALGISGDPVYDTPAWRHHLINSINSSPLPPFSDPRFQLLGSGIGAGIGRQIEKPKVEARTAQLAKLKQELDEQEKQMKKVAIALCANGHVNPDHAGFCHACGRSVVSNTPNPTTHETALHTPPMQSKTQLADPSLGGSGMTPDTIPATPQVTPSAPSISTPMPPSGPSLLSRAGGGLNNLFQSAKGMGQGAYAGIQNAVRNNRQGIINAGMWGVPLAAGGAGLYMLARSGQQKQKLDKEEKGLKRRKKKLEKEAFIGNMLDKYDQFKQTPTGALATGLGSLIPVAGAVPSALDAMSQARAGNYFSAGMSGVSAGLNMLPGVGTAAKLVGKVPGAIGSLATKVLPTASRIQEGYEALSNSKKLAIGAGQLAGNVAAGTIDQNRMANTPEYKQQQAEHQNMLRDFNEWRQHKQQLQQMGQPSGIKTATIDPPSAGSILRGLGRASKYALPAIGGLAAGVHIAPHLSKDDPTEAFRGTLEAGSGVAGAGVGAASGGLLGNVVAQLAAHRMGLDPRTAGIIGSTGGALLGGGLGYSAGHRTPNMLANMLQKTAGGGQDSGKKRKLGNKARKPIPSGSSMPRREEPVTGAGARKQIRSTENAKIQGNKDVTPESVLSILRGGNKAKTISGITDPAVPPPSDIGRIPFVQKPDTALVKPQDPNSPQSMSLSMMRNPSLPGATQGIGSGPVPHPRPQPRPQPLAMPSQGIMAMLGRNKGMIGLGLGGLGLAGGGLLVHRLLKNKTEDENKQVE